MGVTRSGRTLVVGVALAVSGVSPVLGLARLDAQELRFTRYGLAEGLPQSQVLALHQDRDGFLWIGTYGGVTRYDGVSFRTFSRADGLASNSVVALAEDVRGRLIVGGRDGSCLRVAGRFRCLAPEVARRAGLTNDLLPDTVGGYWLAAAGGLLRVDSAGRAAWVDLPLPGSPTALARDGEGGLWVATEGGIARRRSGGEFRVVPIDALRGEVVVRLRATPSGILAATASRVLRIDGGDAAPLSGMPASFGARITDVFVAADGALIVVTQRGALRYADGRLAPLARERGATPDDVNRVFEDRDRTLWLGTESGLVRVTPSAFDNFRVAEGLPHDFVRALVEDPQGRLWVGTRAGIAVRDGARFRAVPLPGFERVRVYALAAPPQGGLLIGTGEGLLHHDGALRRVYREADGLPDRYVSSLVAAPDGSVWVGTVAGLARWTAGRIVPVADPVLDGVSIESVALDSRGRLWVGRSDGGVVVRDASGSRVIGAAEGLSDEAVWSLAPDDHGGMWVGTNGDGAFHVDTAGGIRAFGVEQGLVNPFAWQVLLDRSGAQWFYTNQGITRRTRDGALTHLGLPDGLLDLEGSGNAALEMRDGSLWFGSGLGLSRLRAGVLGAVPAANLTVRIEGATDGTRELPLDDVVLRRGDGALQVRFTVPALRDAANIRFRYRLAGEVEWTDVGASRAITFAGLTPGRHTLQLSARDAGGRESAAPSTLQIRVLPAIWETWWVRGLALLVVLGLAGGMILLRARRMESERSRLEALVAVRTEALRESEERLRAVVEHSTNMFFSYTADRSLTYVSPQCRQIVGLEPEEMRRRWRECFTDHPANAVGALSTDRALATGEQQPPYEMELRHASGDLVWVRVNEAPVVVDGVAVAMVGSLTDITDEKEARTRESRLADQLRQSQKLEAIGRLAGGIAHDFNNLLTAVVGHAELLAEDLPPGSAARDDVAEILRASGRASALVAQLMAFSRQQIIKRATLDLNVVIQESARMLHRIIGSDITLEVTPSDLPAWILADQGQLDQVMVNLVANARDAMPDGGRLEIATTVATLAAGPTAELPPGRYVILRVTDEGTGMDAETRARAFDPFFTTKGPGEGTGLGLATVYGIVQQNGWHIDLTSAPGEGSTFRLYAAAAEPPVRPSGPRYPAPAALVPGDRKRILVVEDEEVVRALVCRTLRQQGYDVIEAPDGDTALAIASDVNGQLDLLLTDVVMPGMNGNELANAIGRLHPDTPVLFMTGHQRGMLGTRGILPDATNVIPKPFRPVDLLQRVQEVLG